MPGPPYASNPYNIAITTFTGSSYNVTSDCLRLAYSRTLADPFAPLRADEGIFEFANFDWSFNPNVHPALRVGHLITLEYTNVLSGNVVIPAYKGRIKNITLDPQLGQRTTVVEALTDFDRLSRTFIDTPLLINMPVSSLFSEVMTRTQVSSYASDLILDMVDVATFNNENVVNILNRIIKSGYYSVQADGAGTIRLRSRYFESITPPLASVLESAGLNYAITGDSIINKMTVRSQPVKQLTDISTVAFLNQPILIPSSGSTGFRVDFLDPRNAGAASMVGSIQALVSGTDYAAFTNSDATGGNLTANLSLNITLYGETAVTSIFNSAGQDAWLTTFQIRGYPLLRAAPLAVQFENSSSQQIYGLYEASFNDMLISNHEFLKDITESIVTDRQAPRDRINLDLINEQPLLWVANVGDIISVQDHANSGTFNIWSIRAMRHEISLQRGEEHRVTFSLRAPATTPWLILDNDPLGYIDADRILAP